LAWRSAADALQDHDRALIVGRPTFGKALLMQGMPLTDGSTMMLVVGHVTTPCGRVVQRTYRGVRQSDYWREAGAALDTAGRPSCRTDSGRIVYGGGIYPDLVLKEPTPVPLWIQQLHERDLLLKWAGALNADSASRPTSAAPDGGRVLSPKLVDEFRGFAHSRGVDVPAGADADAQLRRALLPLLAYARDGNAGYYAELLRNDSWITEAVAALGQAPLSQQKP
jgi:carboxyl-terminal processing protease